jgi:integrase/recombinase XerD
MSIGTNFDTPEELIEAFCRFLTRMGNKPQTVSSRRSDLLALVRWSEAQNKTQFDLDDFVGEYFQPYRDWLITRFKDSTVNRRLTSLNLFLNWCVRQDLLHPRALPLINSVEVKPRKLQDANWLSREDIFRLLEAVKRSGNPYEIAIVTLLARTGLRISDMCVARWQDVEIRQNEGTILLAKTRFGKPAKLPISDSEARQSLLSLAAAKAHSKGDLVFQQGARNLTRRSVEMLIERYSKSAGLSRITPKTLRKSFIMNLVAKGTDPHTVALLAGFERVDMTRQYYEVGLNDYLKAVSIAQRFC